MSENCEAAARKSLKIANDTVRDRGNPSRNHFVLIIDWTLSFKRSFSYWYCYFFFLYASKSNEPVVYFGFCLNGGGYVFIQKSLTRRGFSLFTSGSNVFRITQRGHDGFTLIIFPRGLYYSCSSTVACNAIQLQK